MLIYFLKNNACKVQNSTAFCQCTPLTFNDMQPQTLDELWNSVYLELDKSLPKYCQDHGSPLGSTAGKRTCPQGCAYRFRCLCGREVLASKRKSHWRTECMEATNLVYERHPNPAAQALLNAAVVNRVTTFDADMSFHVAGKVCHNS
jgi:hypothetical protein